MLSFGKITKALIALNVIVFVHCDDGSVRTIPQYLRLILQTLKKVEQHINTPLRIVPDSPRSELDYMDESLIPRPYPYETKIKYIHPQIPSLVQVVQPLAPKQPQIVQSEPISNFLPPRPQQARPSAVEDPEKWRQQQGVTGEEAKSSESDARLGWAQPQKRVAEENDFAEKDDAEGAVVAATRRQLVSRPQNRRSGPQWSRAPYKYNSPVGYAERDTSD